MGQSETSELERLRRFVRWVADHRLEPGTYSDDEHRYWEWIAPDDTEMEFAEVHERAKEALGDA